MRKVSSDAITSFLGDFLARALGFVATAYLARTLQAEGFGVMGIGMSILSYGIWFADMGSSTIGTREMAKPPQDRQFNFGQILSVKAMLSVVLFVVGQLVVLVLYHGTHQWMVSALFLTALLPATFVIEWYFQGRRNFLQIGISRLISGVLYICLLLQFVKTPDDVAMVPMAFTVSLLASAVWLILWRSGAYVESAALSFDMKQYRNLLRQTWSVGTGATFGQVVQFLPPIAIGLLCTAKEAGLYVGATKIVLIILTVDRVFASVFLPAVARTWHTHNATIHSSLPAIYRLLITGSFAACTVFTVFSSSLVELVLGPSFVGADIVLSVLSWFAAGTLLNSFFAYSLIAAGHERLYMRATIIGGIVAAICIVVSAAVSGAVAVAASVVFGEFVIAGLMYREFRKYFAVQVMYPSIVTLAVSIVTAVLLFAFNLTQLWLAPVVLVAYVSIVMIARGLTIKEVKELFAA